MNSLENLEWLIRLWGRDRGISENGTPMSQGIKTLEETTELIDAININDEAKTKDAIGDIFVTLVMVCETSGFTLTECVELAYDEIKDRKGYLRSDGTFIKVEG